MPEKEQASEPLPIVVAGTFFQRNIEDLTALEAGWDGPESLPTSRDSLVKLLGQLSVIMEVMSDSTPTLVPLRSGGVQAEWCSAEKRVEVGVDPDGQMYAFAADGEDYQVEVETVDVLPNEAVEALRAFLHRLRTDKS
jgi:hypothetical protein